MFGYELLLCSHIVLDTTNPVVSAVYQGKLTSDPVMPLLCNRHRDRAAHRLLGKQEDGATKLNLRILGKMV